MQKKPRVNPVTGKNIYAAKRQKQIAAKARGDRGGHPPYVPTVKDQQLVKALKASGATIGETLEILEISKELFARHYRKHWDLAEISMNGHIVRNIYRQGIKDDFRAIPAAKYWATTRLGWKEGNESPPPQEINVNVSVTQVRASIEGKLALLAARASPSAVPGLSDDGGDGVS